MCVSVSELDASYAGWAGASECLRACVSVCVCVCAGYHRFQSTAHIFLLHFYPITQWYRAVAGKRTIERRIVYGLSLLFPFSLNNVVEVNCQSHTVLLKVYVFHYYYFFFYFFLPLLRVMSHADAVPWTPFVSIESIAAAAAAQAPWLEVSCYREMKRGTVACITSTSTTN